MSDENRWVVESINTDQDRSNIEVTDDHVEILVYDGVVQPPDFKLEPATTVKLGGLISGNGTSIDANGVLSVDANLVLYKSSLGTANGPASLGADGKVPSSQLSPVAITNTAVVANTTERLALTAHVGDVAVQSDTSQTFILQKEPPTDAANWVEMKAPTTGVMSVNGHTGAVNLTGRDLTLNVNTFQGRTGEVMLKPEDVLNAGPIAGYGYDLGLVAAGSGLLIDSGGQLSVDDSRIQSAISDIKVDIDNLQMETVGIAQDVQDQAKLIQANADGLAAMVTGLRHLEPVLGISATPPVASGNDDAWIVGVGATGAWAGRDNDVAIWDDATGGWLFESPNHGDSRWNDGDGTNYVWSAADTWIPAGRGMQGLKGDKGDKGDQGESFKAYGSVASYSDLPDSPPSLSMFITDDDGHLWSFDEFSPDADASGWVDMGQVRGNDGATGLQGPKGDKGDAGETFKVSGVVPTSANLPVTPAPLTVIMTQTPPGNLFIYDRTSAAADATTGWVDLGQIAGPKGEKGDKGDDGLGIVPHSDKDWAAGSIVFMPDHKYYRASVAVRTGGLAPGAAATSPAVNPWVDITPPGVTQLANLTDVSVTTPAAGQALVFGAAGKWEAHPQPYYTKTEVDAKVATLVTGVTHGVAVIDLINDPPATPVADEFYIVNTVPTGAWVGHAGALANWNGTAWEFTSPQANEAHLVESQDAIYHWNGTVWNKIAAGSAAPPKVSDVYVIGDIKQSTLTEPQFKTLLGPAEEHNWALADGRDVSTSAWARLTGRNTLPDLRGAFLRMAGRNTNPGWAGGTLNDYQEDSTRMPRTAFSASLSQEGLHRHATGAAAWGENASNWYGLKTEASSKRISNYDGNTYSTPWTTYDGGHTHTATITGGDTETRPKNYSVNFFIRIN